MSFSSHPVWLVGFRPFFQLACLSAALLPLLWVLTFSGRLPLPPLLVGPLQWHAHEMFFGFGWALLGGFLLTASKNWVGIRGYHGATLILLVLAWIAERLTLAFGAQLPVAPTTVSAHLYLITIVTLLLASLIRHRQNDSFRVDNLYFIVLLPLFLPAKWLMLSDGGFAAGVAMTLALFRLAFLLMLERTLSQFMKGVFQTTVLRYPPLDHAIKSLALVMVFAPWLPSSIVVAGEIALATLLFGRWPGWKPHLAMRRIDLGIMHIGYLALVVQLLFAVSDRLGLAGWIGSVTTHVFTVGAMGGIIPAMIIRISKGHTGRKVAFDGLDRAVLWLMIAALLLRIVGPQLAPAYYLLWLGHAAGAWTLGFGLLLWRYAPFLWRARIDGKVH